MGVFNNKNFNSQVFGKYIETVPRVKQNAFLTAGVLKGRTDIKPMLVDQTGGNFISVPMTGLIGGTVLNYDGNTDITATGLDTFIQNMIVVGRAKAWEEKDFSQDITGHDFMEEIAKQVANYWDDVDQATIISILKGIFGVNADSFADKHTYDISNATTSTVGATTLNNAIQKAAGGNKNLFKMAIMHSQVSTNLENLQLLEYGKYNDANGVEKALAIATWNGRTVLIDDDVPTEKVETTAGVYKFQITTKATAGDKIKVGTAELIAGTDFSLSTDTTAGNATAIAGALNSSTATDVAKYTWSASTSYVVATEDSTHYGEGHLDASVIKTTSGTLAIGDWATDTAPVVSTKYTTYLLGDGAFDYSDVGAAVPSETWRDPKTAGGKEWLITRQRKVFAPKGFSFIMPSPAIVSPTDSELETSSNWTVVKDTSNNYYNTKAIPFARIISLG